MSKKLDNIDFDNFNTKDLLHNLEIKYTSGYKYQLHETVAFKLNVSFGVIEPINTRFIKLTTDGWLVIKWGYAWDGASGPTYDSKNTMRGSLVHDALYQLLRMGLIEQMYRDEADDELYDLIRDDGMWYIRAKSWHGAVTWFASSSAEPKSKKKVYSAP